MDTIPILDLIPQQPPFVMIDKLLFADRILGKSVFHIQKDTLFVENGLFSEAGLIENMAQTCAAQIGCINSNDSMKIGVIGAIKNLEIIQLPPYNETIETSIEVTNVIFDTTIVLAKVMWNNRLIASCEMKVSITEKTIG